MKNIFADPSNFKRGPRYSKYNITYINMTIELNTFARKSQNLYVILCGGDRENFCAGERRDISTRLCMVLSDRSWQREKHMSSYIRIDHVPARRGWSAERARVVRVIYYYVVVVVVVVVVVSALAISRQVQFLPFFYPAAVTF